MSGRQPPIHHQRPLERTRRFVQFSRRRVQHSLNTMRSSVPPRQLQSDRYRLPPEIGCDRS